MGMSPNTKTSGFILLAMVLFVNACAQTTSSTSSGKYFGSTPCDSLIRKSSGIPSGALCEFIKWNIEIDELRNDSGIVRISYNYGESQPNTNGFKRGGTTKQVQGKIYSIESETSGGRRFHVRSNDSVVELWLTEMDKNIFLFTDADGKLLVGNAGFSYVLNRVRN
jgi:hypothetical protein